MNKNILISLMCILLLSGCTSKKTQPTSSPSIVSNEAFSIPPVLALQTLKPKTEYNEEIYIVQTATHFQQKKTALNLLTTQKLSMQAIPLARIVSHRRYYYDLLVYVNLFLSLFNRLYFIYTKKKNKG